MVIVVNKKDLSGLSQKEMLPQEIRLDESLAFSTGERMKWERKLNLYLHSCGCAQGAVGLFSGLAIILTVYLLQVQPWPRWETIGLIALPIVLLAMGKIVGRHLDRLRFRKLCKALSVSSDAGITKEHHHE